MTPQQIAQILSEPIAINKLKLKNRLVMGPMAAHAAAKDGRPSDQTIAFFEARARGGVSMIIVGGLVGTSRAWDEAPFKSLLRFDVDTFIPDLKRVADAVHAHSVPIIAEIMPGFGRMGSPGPGRPIISASPMNVFLREAGFPKGFAMPGGFKTPMPNEASIAEIKQCEREMAGAAERVQRAGWDGVEVPAHMSYFATSFLSPRTNWRTDEYGGPAENRARMLVNIVKGIRERVGPEFIVGLRITANDFMPDGQGPEGFLAIAKLVEAAGIDYIALTAGCYEALGNEMPPDADGNYPGNGDARLFKEALSVPVMRQGLHDPAHAAEVIAGGYGDLVMLARPVLADPEYARKACEGRTEAIIQCDRDNLCVRRMMLKMPVRCSVNPKMGLESQGSRKIPSIKRFVQVPAEKVTLGLTGSRWFMKLAASAMAKQQ